MEIFQAEFKDIPAVAQVEQELYPQPWSQKDFEDILGQENFWFWVAKKDREVAGYLVCQVVQTEAELHNIAVAKEYQRQGVAKFLFENLIGALRKKGVQELFLMVRASNTPAQNLYEHFGFQKMGDRPNYYRDPVEKAWIYRLEV